MTIEDAADQGQLPVKNLMRRLVNHSKALSQHRDRAGEQELLALAITIGLLGAYSMVRRTT